MQMFSSSAGARRNRSRRSPHYSRMPSFASNGGLDTSQGGLIVEFLDQRHHAL
jgi:hypothetical protein